MYDLEGITSDSYWVITSVLTLELPISRQVRYSCRQGAFINNERDRSNTMNTIWELNQNLLQVIAEFQYIGRSTLRNAWASVHLVHLVVAVAIMFHLGLILVIFSNHIHQYGLMWSLSTYNRGSRCCYRSYWFHGASRDSGYSWSFASTMATPSRTHRAFSCTNPSCAPT